MRTRRNKDEIECDGCKILTEDVSCHPVTKIGSYCSQCYEGLDQVRVQGHGGILALAQYLQLFCRAHRTLCPVVQRSAQYLFDLLSASEKVLAFQILDLTGIGAWK